MCVCGEEGGEKGGKKKSRDGGMREINKSMVCEHVLHMFSPGLVSKGTEKE